MGVVWGKGPGLHFTTFANNSLPEKANESTLTKEIPRLLTARERFKARSLAD